MAVRYAYVVFPLCCSQLGMSVNRFLQIYFLLSQLGPEKPLHWVKMREISHLLGNPLLQACTADLCPLKIGFIFFDTGAFFFLISIRAIFA